MLVRLLPMDIYLLPYDRLFIFLLKWPMFIVPPTLRTLIVYLKEMIGQTRLLTMQSKTGPLVLFSTQFINLPLSLADVNDHQMGHIDMCRYRMIKVLKDNWDLQLPWEHYFLVHYLQLSPNLWRKPTLLSKFYKVHTSLAELQIDFIDSLPALGFSLWLLSVCLVGGLNAIGPDMLTPQQW